MNKGTLLFSFTLLLSYQLFAQSNCISLNIETQTILEGDTVCLDVTGSGNAIILGMQHSLSWNPEELEFIDITSFGLPDMSKSRDFNLAPNIIEQGKLSFAWINNPASGNLIFEENQLLYSVCMRVKDPDATFSSLSFAQSPTRIEFADNNIEILPYAVINGGVQKNNPNGNPLTIQQICPTAIPCFDNGLGNINLMVTGGQPPYTYQWEGPSGIVESSSSLNSVPAGLYDLTITDQTGLEKSASTEIFRTESAFIESTVLPFNCADQNAGSIDLRVINGIGSYDYAWNHGPTSATISDLEPGNYQVTITSSQPGCERIETYEIRKIPLALSALTLDAPSNCTATDGQIALSLSGLPATVNFEWQNGTTDSSINNLTSGSYAVTATDPTTGCQTTSTFDLAGEANFAVQKFISQPSNCQAQDAKIDLNPQPAGNYSFAWSTGATSEDLENITSGSYSVNITSNDSGCKLTEAVVIPERELEIETDLFCSEENGTALSYVNAMVVSGGVAPFTFDWSTGEKSTDPSTSLIISEENEFTLTVTDADQCQKILGTLYSPCLNSAGNNATIQLEVDSVVTAQGNQVCLKIVANELQSITNASFTLQWNINELQYDNLQAFGLPGLTLSNFSTENAGELLFNWQSADSGGFTGSNITLFEICFTPITEATKAAITFANSPFPLRFTDASGTDQTITFSNGSITTVGAPSPISLFISNATADQGQTVCVDFRANNFQDMISMQYTIKFDPDLWDFEEATNFGLPDLNTTNFALNTDTENGRIRMVWLDFSLAGVTVPNNTRIFSLCFKAKQQKGTNVITITSNPLAIESFNKFSQEVSISSIPGVMIVLSEKVWPGDANFDGIVNEYDLLNIGLGFNTIGPGRSLPSINWQAQSSEDWFKSTTGNETNVKHADTDGNGQVNAADMMALEQNFGRQNPDSPNTPLQPNESNSPVLPALFIQPDTIPPGTANAFSLMLGEADRQVADLFGVAFTVDYDETIFETSSANLNFENSWFGDQASTLHIIEHDEINGQFKLGITRSDSTTVDGFGKIGTLSLTPRQSVALGTETTINVQSIYAINLDEEDRPFRPLSTVSLIDESVGVQYLPDGSIQVFPNPVNDQLNLEIAAHLEVLSIELVSIAGQVLHQTSHPITQLEFRDYPAGVYIVCVKTAQGVAFEKIIKE